ncbi:MAG: hypothetical protein GQ574_28220 [Crocinitomix sp.]|nr:hypothetical protein [Crocinitomix sp.]
MQKKGIEYLFELQRKDTASIHYGFIQQNLGYFHLITEDYDSAIYYLKPLVWRTDSIDITLAYVHNNLARAFLELNRIDSAMLHIEYSLEIDSLNGAAFYNRAFIHMAKKDTLSACHDLSQSKKLGYEAHGKNKSIEEVIADYCEGFTVFIKF